MIFWLLPAVGRGISWKGGNLDGRQARRKTLASTHTEFPCWFFVCRHRSPISPLPASPLLETRLTSAVRPSIHNLNASAIGVSCEKANAHQPELARRL